MEEILEIVFTGNSILRDDFIGSYTEKVREFLGSRKGNEFCMFSKEMVKNIYDHAGGNGICKLRREGNIVFFEIKDNGTERFNFDELQKLPSSKQGSGVNFGIGLGVIEESGKEPGVEIVINTEKGFSYTGKYPLNF